MKERRAKSHSKCSICSDISSKQCRLVGVNTPAAIEERQYLSEVARQHEGQHLSARSQMDRAGLQSIVNPREIWTICVDAATQRNFELPKFQFRPPKNFTGRPFWGFKLMACYVYGDGFYPYLVHDSQFMGANLTWTVIWLTLTELRRKRGYWPATIHLQFDNTKGENKNETMIMVAAWLAATKVSQVRVYFLMVGHTHIVIDHIFGVITVGLRRTELLTPNALMKNIDISLAACPVYQAKPTRWLHCLWDFKNWAAKTMQCHDLRRLFGGEVQDEDGTYTGMYDFVLNRSSEFFAVLQYREHCSHSFRPASGPCKTIKFLPVSPPQLQELKPFDKWKFVNSNSIESTITLCARYARSLANANAEQEMVKEWAEIISSVPSSIFLLKPSLALSFEFFDNDTVPRLQAPVDAGRNEETTEANLESVSFESWKRANMGFRTGPLAIDPVISSEQSEAEFNQAKQFYFATLGFQGPGTSRSTRVLMGHFVLAQTDSAGGVRLFCVRSLGPMMTPNSVNLSCTAVEYEHTPNPNVSGLFGTFKLRSLPLNGKNQECRRTLTRNEILVYNAELQKAVKSPKLRVLSLASLRALMQALPVEYPMPPTSQLPETHLAKEVVRRPASRQKPPNARPQPSRRDKTQFVEQSSSSSNESEDESDDSGSHDDSSGNETSSSSENDSSDDQCNETNSSQHEERQVADVHLQDSTVVVARTGAAPVETDVKEGALCFVTVQEHSKIFCSNDKLFRKMKPPVALVFVRSKTAKRIRVNWFLLLGTVNFNPNVKWHTFAKHWTHPNWTKIEKLKRKEAPTREQIFQYWSEDEVGLETVVPVAIPAEMYDTASVVQKDNFRLPTKFVTETLLTYFASL